MRSLFVLTALGDEVEVRAALAKMNLTVSRRAVVCAGSFIALCFEADDEVLDQIGKIPGVVGQARDTFVLEAPDDPLSGCCEEDPEPLPPLVGCDEENDRDD